MNIYLARSATELNQTIRDCIRLMTSTHLHCRTQAVVYDETLHDLVVKYGRDIESQTLTEVVKLCTLLPDSVKLKNAVDLSMRSGCLQRYRPIDCIDLLGVLLLPAFEGQKHSLPAKKLDMWNMVELVYLRVFDLVKEGQLNEAEVGDVRVLLLTYESCIKHNLELPFVETMKRLLQARASDN